MDNFKSSPLVFSSSHWQLFPNYFFLSCLAFVFHQTVWKTFFKLGEAIYRNRAKKITFHKYPETTVTLLVTIKHVIKYI